MVKGGDCNLEEQLQYQMHQDMIIKKKQKENHPKQLKAHGCVFRHFTEIFFWKDEGIGQKALAVFSHLHFFTCHYTICFTLSF